MIAPFWSLFERKIVLNGFCIVLGWYHFFNDVLFNTLVPHKKKELSTRWHWEDNSHSITTFMTKMKWMIYLITDSYLVLNAVHLNVHSVRRLKDGKFIVKPWIHLQNWRLIQWSCAINLENWFYCLLNKRGRLMWIQSVMLWSGVYRLLVQTSKIYLSLPLCYPWK